MRLLLLLATLCLLLSCSKKDTAMGGSTETIGIVVNHSGDPIAGASVVLISSDFDPMAESELFDTLTTDSVGEYNFSTVQNGSYNLQIEGDDKRAFRKNVVVTNGEISENIVDTLLQTGGVQGVVQYQYEENHEGIFLIFLGTERYTTTVDAAGNFAIDNLAEGEYHVKILTESKEYENVERIFSVHSSKTNVLKDTVTLSYIGIPTPQNVTVSYNDLLQEAVVRWDGVQSDDLYGYYLYRLDRASGAFIFLSNKVIEDTCFIDRSLPFGTDSDEVRYKVHAVHNNGLTGKFSETVSASFYNNYTVETSDPLSVNLKGQLKTALVARTGHILLTSSASEHIYWGNTTTKNTLETVTMPNGARPFDITELQDSTLLISTHKGLYHVDTQGGLKHDYGKMKALHISAESDSCIFYSTKDPTSLFENRINIFNAVNGDTSDFFFTHDQKIEDILLYDGYLYVLLSEYGTVRLVQLPLHNPVPRELYVQNSVCGGSTLGSDGTSLYLMCDTLLLQFREGRLYSRTVVPSEAELVVPIDATQFYLIDTESIIHSYKKRIFRKMWRHDD